MTRTSRTLTTELDFDLSAETLCDRLLGVIEDPDAFDLHDVYLVRDGKEFDLIGRKRLVTEAVKLLQTSARVAIGSSRALSITVLTNATCCAAVATVHGTDDGHLRWIVAPTSKKVSLSPALKSFKPGTAGRIPPGRSLAQSWASLRQRSTGFSVSRSLIYGRWPLTEELRTKAATARYSPKLDEFVRKDVVYMPAIIFTDEDNTVLGFFDLCLQTAARPRKPNGVSPDSSKPTPAHRGVKNPEQRILLTQCVAKVYENEMIAAGATRVYYCESRMIGFTTSGWMHPMNVPARYKAVGVRRLEHRGEGEVAEALEKLNALRQMGYYAVIENLHRAASGYSTDYSTRTKLSPEQISALTFNVLVTDPEALRVVCPVEDMEAV
jgi:hypothetical protein